MRNYPLGRAHIYIGGRDLSEFQAKLMTDYAISGYTITNAYNQGPDRSSFVLFRQTHGLLSITLPLDFYGDSKAEVMECLSAFNAQCEGVVELNLSDGFSYTCMLEEPGETQWLCDTWCTVDYRFVGIRHKEALTVTEQTPVHIQNSGTWPRNDCIITLKNLIPVTNVPVILTISDGNTVFLTWKIETAGGQYAACSDLVLDGVNKRNLWGGGNVPTGTMTWTDYPYLLPGENVIALSGGCTTAGIVVDYTPAYL